MHTKSGNTGLEGVVVGDTALSLVDGEQGRLIIRGLALEDLAGRAGFAEACHLLWKDRLPDADEAGRVERDLAEGRAQAFELLPQLALAIAMEDPMSSLRAAVSHMEVDESLGTSAFGRLTGSLAVFSAAWWRHRQGLALLRPDPELNHAADYLRLVTGEPPTDTRAQALSTYLVTVSDHGMNASTFTSRVIASTASDLVSAVVGGIGALKGPLHGGAPGPVLDMLDAIGEPGHAAAWIQKALDDGRRIMGMGHRIYRVRDPRAAVLEKATRDLVRTDGESPRLALARAVEETARTILKERKPDRALEANVEFYTAVLLEAVGLPRELFANTFACARVAGWCAHVQEQRAEGRLIRPKVRYTGRTV